MAQITYPLIGGIRLSLSSDVVELLSQFGAYAQIRAQFLRQVDRTESCRDPFTEFSEILVAKLLGATIAGSRVQEGYDLIRPNKRFVQVKSLCNPNQTWTNEHHIQFPDGVDDYALVVFAAFQLEAVLIFPRETLGQVCALLGKAHPNQEATLQFTQRNYKAVLTKSCEFEKLG